MPLTRRRLLAFRAVLFIFTLTLVAMIGEVALRVIYRDGGRTTMGGPGPHAFVYDYAVGGRNPARFPSLPVGEGAGRRRVLIFGDSITWGVGVRDWRQTYPLQLLERLNARDERYDVQIIAAPGRNMSHHAARVIPAVRRLAPDIVIYQWYVNDLESDRRQRPRTRPLIREPVHTWLREHSYFYYVVENRLRTFRPSSYQDYLRDTFGEGTREWAAFREAFHRWAVHSTAHGARTLVFLYPQVPFRGTNPLADIHARMRALDGQTEIRYPALMLRGDVRGLRADATAEGGWVRQGGGHDGPLASAGPLPLLPGRQRLGARMRLDRVTSAGPAATIEIEVDGRTARHSVGAEAFPVLGRWTDVSVEFEASAPLSEAGWSIRTEPGAFVSVAGLSLPVTYPRLDVIDLTDRLNEFDTHVSIFDAHPNVRAHAVIAEALAEWVRSTEREPR